MLAHRLQHILLDRRAQRLVAPVQAVVRTLSLFVEQFAVLLLRVQQRSIPVLFEVLQVREVFHQSRRLLTVERGQSIQLFHFVQDAVLDRCLFLGLVAQELLFLPILSLLLLIQLLLITLRMTEYSLHVLVVPFLDAVLLVTKPREGLVCVVFVERSVEIVGVILGMVENETVLLKPI